MRLGRLHLLAASLAFAVFALLDTQAAFAADDLQSVLSKLDAAAANFHTASADFVFDTETLQPIADTDIQKGTVDYERKGTDFKMAAHINDVNGKPVIRAYTYEGGLLTYYDKPSNQITKINRAGAYESYIILGFGASGKDLAAKWDIAYGGAETIDGVKTAKLELVAGDPEVRKHITKVTIWVDPERAVSLKQRFDEGPAAYRICTYKNFKTNQSLPSSAFTFKTDPNPTTINR
jgi:outer membrane lipoprotein-sorting protein